MIKIETILLGDAAEQLRTLDADSVQCCVTSPPYFGLRDYGVPGQIGQEAAPEEYIGRLVEVFREVHRVLRPDGTLWLNIGDSYTSGGRKTRDHDEKLPARTAGQRPNTPEGMKPKDLIGIPWMLAFALRSDGWYLRQDIIWHKPNAMPESVRDRCTKSHEHVFLLSNRSTIILTVTLSGNRSLGTARNVTCAAWSGKMLQATLLGSSCLGLAAPNMATTLRKKPAAKAGKDMCPRHGGISVMSG